METKVNRSTISRVMSGAASAGLAFLLALAVGAGCASARKGGSSEPIVGADGAPLAEPMGPPEPYGPPSPPVPPTYGPEPVPIKPVVLVLGPGLARGFAYVGVIRALVEASIPIGAVFGTEMGALIGGLYAMDPNLNRFEWALMRFKKDVFLQKKSFLGVFDRNREKAKIDLELERVFAGKDLSDAQIPVRIGVLLKDSNTSLLVDKGQASHAVRAALASPGFLHEASWEGVPALSLEAGGPFLTAEATGANIGPIILVDVADSAGTGYVAPPDQVPLVLRPNMKGIDKMDFNKRTEIAFRGRSAVLERLGEIRRLTGVSDRRRSAGGPAP